MSNLLAFGLGYSAAALGKRLLGERWTVIGTGRSGASLSRIASQGFIPLAFDGQSVSGELLDAIRAATHILVSAAPDERGDPFLPLCRDAIAAAPNLQWIGYLSTIGVYGDHDGGWVDEATPPRPVSDRSIERLAAEDAWLALAAKTGVPAHIFRLAGIYGPGRNPLERLMAGERHSIFKPGQVFNRTHVEDIAAVLYAAIEKTRAGDPAMANPIFNVTDDEPAPPQDVNAYAANLLGLEPPTLIPIEQANLSPMARSFYSENKRVRNERIRNDLGVALKFPTYREGLSAIHASLKTAAGS